MSDKIEKRGIYLYINDKEVENNIKSIKSEMSKMINEQNRMTIGSKEYIAQGKKIKELDGILRQHRESIRDTASSWSIRGLADGVNRYFALVTAAIASITGMMIGFKKAIDTFNDFEKEVSILGSLTGLAGDELKWMADQAKEMSVGMTNAGARVTYSAKDIVTAFKLVGSAKPELLQNKEALRNFTEEVINLALASQMELPKATSALAQIMNQYGAASTEAGKYVNILGAAAKEGTGEIDYIAEAVTRFGTVAKTAGISIEKSVSVMELFAMKGIDAEKAGIGFRNVLVTLMGDQKNYTAGQFDFNKAMINLKPIMNDVTVLTSLFGKENVIQAQILAQNTAYVDKFSKSISGTNVAYEQAMLNTDNNSAKLDQAKNKVTLIAMELGEKLAPMLTMSTNLFNYFMKALLALPRFVSDNKVMLISLAGAILALNAATIKAIASSIGLNVQQGYNFAIQKLNVFWTNLSTVATGAYITVTNLLTGRITLATAAQRLWNLTMAKNPLGAVIIAVTALAAGAVLLYEKLNQVSAAEKVLGEVRLEAKKKLVEERFEVEQLLKVAKDKSKSDAERIEAIKQLNKISPEYLGNLSLENINTIAAKKSTDDYIKSLEKLYMVEAAKAKFIELDKTLLELQDKYGKTNVWQEILSFMSNLGEVSFTAAEINDQKITKQIESIKEQKKALMDILDTTSTTNDASTPATAGNTSKKGGVTIALTPEQIAEAKKQADDYNAMWKKAKEEELATSEMIQMVGADNYFEYIRKRKSEDESYFAFQDRLVKENTELWIQAQLDILNDDSQNLVTGQEAWANYLLNRKNDQESYIEFTKRKSDEYIELQRQAVLDSQNEDDIILEYGQETYIEYIEKRKNVDESYYEWKKRKTQEQIQKEHELLKQGVDGAVTLVNYLSDFETAAKNRELTQAGENEEKKKEINKRYADKEFAITAARIIVSTAAAIMQGYAQLGPIAGTVAAILLGGIGVIQLDDANAARKSVKSLYIGGETGDGYGSPDESGRKRAGFVHQNEYVIPEFIRSDPQVMAFENVIEAKRRRAIGMPGYYYGGETSPSGNKQSDYLAPILNKLVEVLTKPIQAVAVYGQEETIRIKKEIAKHTSVESESKF